MEVRQPASLSSRPSSASASIYAETLSLVGLVLLSCSADHGTESVIRLCLRLARLRRHNRVFCGLGYPELHNLLGGDLDSLASSGVAAHPGLAVHTNEPADSRQNEDAVLLDLGHGRLGECTQIFFRSLLGDLALIYESLEQLCLRHRDSPSRHM